LLFYIVLADLQPIVLYVVNTALLYDFVLLQMFHVLLI